eukprot:7012673-Prymnesium_polylepis.1
MAGGRHVRRPRDSNMASLSAQHQPLSLQLFKTSPSLAARLTARWPPAHASCSLQRVAATIMTAALHRPW